ncbi:hypothetical protein GS399_16680 [Pedobacter sp. HMF7647]|uniref:FimB/Mfa2 family fimbrial subunit n=1 Tax=Hufsiella arboris TaxID=2695275 RepID=A0A7K1YE25_9SPHI|nr:FimB/Mfa2 family fimbrial subunit [Hufsiella arboris]MXV52611.1 hypothetical protein [Hufsiella arboris]
MKNTASLLFACMVIAAASCKKDGQTAKQEPQKSTKLYPLTFRVGQFSTDIKPFGTTVSDLKDQIKYLHYFVYFPNYEQDGPFIHTIDQVADSTENFGTIKDSLAAGEYYIGFAGGNTSKFKNYYIGEGSGSEARPGLTQNIPFCDSFGYLYHVTITGEQVTKDIVMQRMVAKITVKVTDALPANVAKFVLTKHNSSPLVDMTGLNGIYLHVGEWPDQTVSYQVKPADIGKKNFSLHSYVYSNPQSFTLDCYDTNGKLITSRELLPPYAIERNKQYNFSGKLFESNSSFQISVDDQWTGSESIPFAYDGKNLIRKQ